MNFKNFTKYITFTAFVFAILRYVPQYKLETTEVLVLTGLLCSTFVIIDTITPCIIVDKSKCVKPQQNHLVNKSKSRLKPK
jgi:hypothetical protein